MSDPEAGVDVVFAEDLDALVEPFAQFIDQAAGDVLAPAWSVVPTMGIRQWLDQETSTYDPTGSGGVAANLEAIFAKDLAVKVEQLALQKRWQDFGTETTALRILGALSISSFQDAHRRAEAIDDIVRWRPHLLEPTQRHLIPTSVREAMDALDLFEHGPAAQRALVLEMLRRGEIEGLPTQLAVFGLSNVPGGERFLDLLDALGATLRVRCFLPTPTVADLALDEDGPAEAEEVAQRFSWRRDADESLALIRRRPWKRSSLEPRARATSTLGALQRRLIGAGQDAASGDDGSVQLVGGFGDGRQAEQLRDVIFEAIGRGVEPHEILVVSPKPAAFAQAIERHWSYQLWEPDPGPRLPNEVIDVTPARLENRLGASLALLRLIGSYVTLEQVVELVCHPAVSRTLGISFDDSQLLVRRATEGKLIFGVSPEQRARFDIYTDDPIMPLDVGTWERLSDAIAAASLYPPALPDGSHAHDQPVSSVGEPGDLALIGRLQPLLRLVEDADPLRPSPTLDEPPVRKTLAEWLELLSTWMRVIATPDGVDDSFERVVRRFERALEASADLGSVTFDLDQMIELWASMAQASRYSRVFGRGGVVVAGLDALAFAPFRVVCILGLDEEKLPDAALPSPIMAIDAGDSARRSAALGDPDPRRAACGALLAAVLSAREQLVISWNVRDEATGSVTSPSIALAELLEELGHVTGATGDLAEAVAETARRHAFSSHGARPRFDTRILRVAEPVAPEPAPQVEVAEAIAIADVMAFFRDPVGHHVRRAENVLLPQGLEAAPIRPALEVDALTAHRFRDAYLREVRSTALWQGIVGQVTDQASYEASFAALQDATDDVFASMCLDEQLAGDVPPIFWMPIGLKPALDLYLFDLAFDLADFEPITDPAAPALGAIDLGDHGVLELMSTRSSRTARFEPQRVLRPDGDDEVVVVDIRPKVGKGMTEMRGRLMAQLIELLALRIGSPDAECKVLSFFAPGNVDPNARNMKKWSVPKGAWRLAPFFELRATPESLPAERARAQLAQLVGLYRAGMEDVIPLFAQTSEALAFSGWCEKAGRTPFSTWEGAFKTSGERTELAHELLFPLRWAELEADESFRSIAQTIRTAADGVSFWWASPTQRPAPASLQARHPGFAAQEQAILAGIEEASDETELAKYSRVRQPLVGDVDA